MWDVLDIQDGKLLLISHYSFERRPYYCEDDIVDNEISDINWEDSDIRAWLNNDFLYDTFSEEEISRIESVTISNPSSEEFFRTYYPQYFEEGQPPNLQFYENTNPCGDTTDRIFLLSWEEFIRYYGPLEVEGNMVSAHNAECPIKYNINNDVWWLRSAGFCGSEALYISILGEIGGATISFNADGLHGVEREFALRPAMWLNIM